MSHLKDLKNKILTEHSPTEYWTLQPKIEHFEARLMAAQRRYESTYHQLLTFEEKFRHYLTS